MRASHGQSWKRNAQALCPCALGQNTSPDCARATAVKKCGHSGC
jgi:hypothetical protein